MVYALSPKLQTAVSATKRIKGTSLADPVLAGKITKPIIGDKTVPWKPQE